MIRKESDNMKVKDVITHVAETRPHVYSDDVLCRWLSDLEGRIHNEVFQKQEDFSDPAAFTIF